MRGRKWTKAEDDLIRRRRGENVAVPLIAAEIGREVKATYARASLIGAKVMARTEWTEAEVDTLITMNAAKDPIKVIARALDRTTGSVRWKLDDLDLAGGRLKYWTEEEDAVLRTFAEGKTVAEVKLKPIVVALAAVNGGVNRDEATVDGRIRGLKLYAAQRRRWSLEEIAEMKKALADGDLVAFAARTGRPIERVEAKAMDLGLIVPKRLDIKVVAPAKPFVKAVTAVAPVRLDAKDRVTVLPVVTKPVVAVVSGGPAVVQGFATVKVKPESASKLGMSDEVARFMAERGVTRVQEDPAGEIVTALRRRGFMVVSDGDGWVIDGRRRLGSFDELEAFARVRGGLPGGSSGKSVVSSVEKGRALQT